MSQNTLQGSVSYIATIMAAASYAGRLTFIGPRGRFGRGKFGCGKTGVAWKRENLAFCPGSNMVEA
jgi:hypothetical protein